MSWKIASPTKKIEKAILKEPPGQFSPKGIHRRRKQRKLENGGFVFTTPPFSTFLCFFLLQKHWVLVIKIDLELSSFKLAQNLKLMIIIFQAEMFVAPLVAAEMTAMTIVSWCRVRNWLPLSTGNCCFLTRRLYNFFSSCPRLLLPLLLWCCFTFDNSCSRNNFADTSFTPSFWNQ